MSVLIEQPFFALAPAAFFFACSAVSRSRWSPAAGSLWLLYFFYELAMKYRLLCSGECNIRIDLLAVYPALLAASLAAVVALGIAASKRGNASQVAPPK